MTDISKYKSVACHMMIVQVRQIRAVIVPGVSVSQS
jgi:hypothetical protein